jgi:cytochrome c biogenesis protein ResB
MGGERRLLLNEWLLGFFFLCFVSLTLCISSPVFSAENEDTKKTEKRQQKRMQMNSHWKKLLLRRKRGKP